MVDNKQNSFSLHGKIAIITGASKGIGEAIAVAYASAGATVVVSSRKAESVDEVASRLKNSGAQAEACAAHMGCENDITALVNFTLATYGGIDILVNNAATNPVFAPLMGINDAACRKVMDVNLMGPLTLSKAVQPHMLRRGGGAIINIASVGGLTPERFLGMYSVSKAALISLTKVMAKEWGEAGIRVNAICPGLIKTRFSAALWQNEAVLKEAMRHVPTGRIGVPMDVAYMALFLASEAAAYCNGGIYTVDGGMMA